MNTLTWHAEGALLDHPPGDVCHGNGSIIALLKPPPSAQVVGCSSWGTFGACCMLRLLWLLLCSASPATGRSAGRPPSRCSCTSPVLFTLQVAGIQA